MLVSESTAVSTGRDGRQRGTIVLDTNTDGVDQRVSTGDLPSWERIDERVLEAYERNVTDEQGLVADYIPELAAADPSQFGVCIADVEGSTHVAGDAEVEFTVQSISKAFVYALVCQEFGHTEVGRLVGVNNTGLAFNSVIAVELNDGHPMNPMVNAGAIATTALMPGATLAEKWENIRTGLSAFAGRQLSMDGEVYRSEAETNTRNEAIAKLLKSYGRIAGDSSGIVDIYTRQCSLRVSARDLAIMGATLADGGVNPVTKQRVISPIVCRDTLAVLATSGLYERSGEWMFEIGLPGKSGVSGGIVTVAPGKGALGTFSPRLDSAGNSVRGQKATAFLSRSLGLNIFASDSEGDRHDV